MKKLIIALTLAVMFAFPSGPRAQTTLTFTTGDDQSHGRSKAMNAVLTECFSRMGIALKITPMPSKRSLVNANNGIEDGNFLRTDNLSYAFPNLVMVPEKISVNHVVAFSKNPGLDVSGWKSLFQYRVVCVNGWKNCERELQDHRGKTMVKDEYLMFTMLHYNRADIGIFGMSTGQEALKELGYNEIKASQPPIVTNDLYLYVHKKHAGLIPEIVKTLRAMKADGTYQDIVNQYQPGWSDHREEN